MSITHICSFTHHKLLDSSISICNGWVTCRGQGDRHGCFRSVCLSLPVGSPFSVCGLGFGVFFVLFARGVRVYGWVLGPLNRAQGVPLFSFGSFFWGYPLGLKSTGGKVALVMLVGEPQMPQAHQLQVSMPVHLQGCCLHYVYVLFGVMA